MEQDRLKINKTGLPWIERVTMFSINPHAASITDIADMGAYIADHYGKYDDLVCVAGDVCSFLFNTFSFSRTKQSQEALKLHDELLAALDQVPGVDDWKET